MPKRKSTETTKPSKGGKKTKETDNSKRIADLLAAGYNEHGGALTDPLLDQLVAGRTGIKVLFPLCADSFDMKRLYDRGHEVVGIEMSKSLILRFYKKQSLEYTIQKIPIGTLYKNKDGRLRIYCCDFFQFGPAIEGRFDAIVDQRAICSVYPDDKPRYVKKIKTLLAPNFTYFFETSDINREKFPKRRGHFIIKDVENWFGKRFKIEVLQTLDAAVTMGNINHVSLVMKLVKK